jgi:hypothetical protein
MIRCGKHFIGLCTDDSAARAQVLTSNNHGGAAENNVSLIETGSDARLFSVRRAPLAMGVNPWELFVGSWECLPP